jgi:hypothetical protein
MGKHSNLLWNFVTYVCKKFYNIGPWFPACENCDHFILADRKNSIEIGSFTDVSMEL